GVWGVVEHDARQRAQTLVVLHDQDGLVAPRRFGRRRGSGRTQGSAVDERKVDREDAALAGCAVDLDRAAGLGHDPVAGREAEAGTRTGSLGGEERLEEALPPRRVPAAPGFPDAPGP